MLVLSPPSQPLSLSLPSPIFFFLPVIQSTPTAHLKIYIHIYREKERYIGEWEEDQTKIDDGYGVVEQVRERGIRKRRRRERGIWVFGVGLSFGCQFNWPRVLPSSLPLYQRQVRRDVQAGSSWKPRHCKFLSFLLALIFFVLLGSYQGDYTEKLNILFCFCFGFWVFPVLLEQPFVLFFFFRGGYFSLWGNSKEKCIIWTNFWVFLVFFWEEPLFWFFWAFF